MGPRKMRKRETKGGDEAEAETVGSRGFGVEKAE